MRRLIRSGNFSRNFFILAGLICFSAVGARAGTPNPQEGNVRPGRYEIQSAASNKAVEVDASDGRTVRQWKVNHQVNQRWDIEYAERDYVTIKSAQNGMALDIEGGTARDGAPLILAQPSGGDSQLWRLEDAGDGRVSIVSRFGKAVDLPDASRENGTRLQLWKVIPRDAEWFQLIRISGPLSEGPGNPAERSDEMDERGSYQLGYSMGVEDYKAQLRRTYARHKGRYSPEWEEAFIEGYYDGYDSGRGDTSGMRPAEKDAYDSGYRMGRQDYQEGRKPNYTHYADRFDPRNEPFFRRGYGDGYYSGH
ncbi:MAG: RICIN domain-containing protein [Candidatus Acidiferrales bacterium]